MFVDYQYAHKLRLLSFLKLGLDQPAYSRNPFMLPSNTTMIYFLPELPKPAAMMLLAGLVLASGTYAEPANPMGDYLNMDLSELMQTRITGSHISVVNASTTGPITLIDRETIDRSGATSLEALLQQLPLSAGYAGNQSNAYWGVNGNGSTHVNLRGLGINRTLVLLDGHRLTNGGTGANAAVDLNAIPLAIVERIEIFRDGASAIYGADAVAGVVNIITRSGLVGGDASVRYGETSKQDGAEQAAQISWGARGEQGLILFNLSRFESDPINMAARATCGLSEVSGELVCGDSSNTIGGRARLANGQRVNFNQIAGGDGDFYEPYSASKHNFNANPYLNAVNPIQRTSLTGKGEYKFNAQTRLISTLIYTQRESEQLASPGTIGLNRPIMLAADHPTNPTGQALVLERRRLLEAGTRNFYQDVTYYYGLVGLEGVLGEHWNWQAAVNWSRNTGTDGWTNVANLDRIDQSLDTSRCSNAPGASIPCGDYLGYGDLSPQLLDFLMLDTTDHGGNELQNLSANLSGDFMQLPAGALMLATGLELRRDKAWRNPDPLTRSGTANINPQEPVSGQLEAIEGFIEAQVPLLKALPGIESLDLSTALRYSDYDHFGDTTNYKLGLNWQVTPSLQVRSNHASAFRTPNIPELFSGEQKLNLITRDPCNNWNILPPDSLIYQNCQADAVPANYQQLVTSVLTTLGGNAALKPEEAQTRTLGIQWQPAFAVPFTFSLDYFNITIDEAIVSIDGNTRLAACYNSSNMSHPFCNASHFTRNPSSGDINFLSTRLVNAAEEQQEGIDLGLFSEFALGNWQAKVDWESSYLHSYEIQLYTAAPKTDYAGKVTTGRGSYLQWRSLARLTLERGDWSGAYSLQYLDSGAQLGVPPEAIGARQESVTYQHLQLQYQASHALQLRLGIDNLFDQSAPYVANWLDVNTDTMTYDVSGRRWYLTARLSW
jgi:iron complex outermembrane receptor protein